MDPRPNTDLPPTPSPSTRRFGATWLLAGLLALHAGLLVWSTTASSVAFDEYAHLPAGLSYLKHREFGMLNLAPPLARVWQAAPVLLALKPDVPPLDPYRGQVQKDRYWRYAEAFLRANAADYQRTFIVARLAMIPVSCFGAWVVYRWASSLYGAGGGLSACAAYVLCPNICAHASLVGTDAATTVAFLTAMWLWWRFCRRRSWGNLALATLAVGLAHLCKFSALLLWPAMLATAACVVATDPIRPWKRLLAGFAIACAGAVLIVNVGYLFEGVGKRVGEFALQSSAMRAIFGALPDAMPVPLPEQLVLGFDALKWEVEQGFSGYILGEHYRGSRWYYFPVALAVKLPLATIALIVLSFALGRRSLSERNVPLLADEAAVFANFAIILLGLTVLAGVNLGMRYVLPALPFAFILIGRAWQVTRERARWRWVVPVLLVGTLIANLSVAPRYLTFFNSLAGRAGNGQYLLNDSNHDWGQGLLDLKRWMDANGVKKVQLGYFGRVDPSVYGIDYDLLTEKSGTEYVAVSSYYLVGMSHRLPSRHGPAGQTQIEAYRELQRQPRVAIPGGVIHVFRREDVAAAMAEHRGTMRR